MRLINNSVLIQADQHFDFLLGSDGKPFLKLVDHFEPYYHAITSGIVLEVCETLNHDYPLGTTVEVKKGDHAIFHYMSIRRTRDGHKINHDKMIGKNYAIDYINIFAVVREGEVIPVNGNVILEGEREEYISNLIIPDYLKKKTSKSICTIKYLSTPLTHYNDLGEDYDEEDSNDWYIGQKVIIPSHKALDLQQGQHSIIDSTKIYYRCQRRWMTDYNWVENSVRLWREFNPVEEQKPQATQSMIRDFKDQLAEAVTEEADDGSYKTFNIPTRINVSKKYTGR